MSQLFDDSDAEFLKDQRKVKCVKISGLPTSEFKDSNGIKTSVCRHLDTILIRCEQEVGEILRVVVLAHPRNTDIRTPKTTVAFIELKDSNRLEDLAIMLDKFKLHQNEIIAGITYHHFNNLDDYYPRPIDCNECSQIIHHFENIKQHFEQQAIATARKSVKYIAPKPSQLSNKQQDNIIQTNSDQDNYKQAINSTTQTSSNDQADEKTIANECNIQHNNFLDKKPVKFMGRGKIFNDRLVASCGTIDLVGMNRKIEQVDLASKQSSFVTINSVDLEEN